MRIKTLKDWKRYHIKQHPLFYIFILYMVLDWSIFAKLYKSQEREIDEPAYGYYYYVDEEEALGNRKYLNELSNVVLPLVIASQLIIIFWISLRFNIFIKFQYFPYTKDLIWLLWTILGICGYFFAFHWVIKKVPWDSLFVLIAFMSYIPGQWFLFKFWRKYLIANYYVQCPKCKKDNLVDKFWFNFSQVNSSIKDCHCYSCKNELNLFFHTKVSSNEEYLFNWDEKMFKDKRYF